MYDPSLIRKICKEASYLTEEEIEKIIETCQAMDVCAESFDYDVFIDIPSKCSGEEAIVVYHGNSEAHTSLYNESPIGKKALRVNEPGVLRTMETGVHTKNIKARTQENRYVIQNVYPIRLNQKVIGTIINEHDTDYDIRANFNVQRNSLPMLTSTLNSIYSINNHLVDAILIFDNNGNLQFKNLRADTIYRSLGYMEDIEGVHYDNLSLDGTTFNEVINRSESQYKDNREVKIGDYFFLVKQVVVPEDDFRVAMILHDITQLRNRETEIVLKTVAIGEIHHRIKNNLQTIASLLRMQSRRSSNNESKTLLKDSVNRILSIAATHELLSQQLNDDISLWDVLQNVAGNIRRCYSDNDHIKLEICANEDFNIDSDRATVLALIVNELVQNCYDHAFHNFEEGKIRVEIQRQGKRAGVTVTDNGSGFTNNQSFDHSLGLTIVKTYVKDKLKGTIDFTTEENGTTISIYFDL
ncbi:sensor histidine kinase [Mesobacillus zeae]|nr:histidine kinase N-terminal domain-containing protein [Mesobacillus zeae]